MFSKGRKIVLERILTGTIVEWDDQRGYGYLQRGQARVFLHRREFAKIYKRPANGDKIRFAIGLDAKGRTCAKAARHLYYGGGLMMKHALFLSGLLILPIFATIRANLDQRLVAGWIAVVSLGSYVLYAADKRLAETGLRRIPENSLHLLEILGGWPGAYLAQRRFRHKTSKGSFQAVFWTIILMYQLAGIYAIRDWRMAKTLLTFERGQAHDTGR